MNVYGRRLLYTVNGIFMPTGFVSINSRVYVNTVPIDQTKVFDSLLEARPTVTYLRLAVYVVNSTSQK
jgi:hypothetical protein